jgi:DNA-binding CsgD family transcriptional regulator
VTGSEQALAALEATGGASLLTPARAAALRADVFDGRWTFVEQFEQGSRRYFLARRNGPAVAAKRGLSAREREVVRRVVAGHSNKRIAFELGIAQSTVATHLRAARRKLVAGAAPELLCLLGGAAGS